MFLSLSQRTPPEGKRWGRWRTGEKTRRHEGVGNSSWWNTASPSRLRSGTIYKVLISMDRGQSSSENAGGAEDGGPTVEIKIRTLNAQSYTLRIEKDTPVPVLKDRIASLAGIPVENQRLIYGGKVLKDDQLLSAYNVEDGHTLHLVARQPPPPPVSTGQDQAGSGSHGPADMFIVSPRNRSGHVSHSLLMGTINIPDTGEGGMPDVNRIISAVLNSVGIGNAASAAQVGTGTGGTLSVGVLPTRPAQATGSDGQARPGATDSRVQTGPPGFDNGPPRELEATLQIDALYGSPPSGILDGAGPNAHPPFRILQHPMVVPDALTTMSQYLDRLEQSFSIAESGTVHNTGGTSIAETANHPESTSGQTSPSLSVQGVAANAAGVFPEESRSTSSLPSPTPTNDGPDSGVLSGPPARRSPTPQALGSIVQRVQALLSGQAGSALSRLAMQLENEPSLLEPAARADVQATAIRDGHMMQNLGALLLELGRTTLTLRMGQTPAESVVNAGPAVFISPSGPNPMMVQSVPLQTGVALGTLPVGASQPSGGIVGPTLGPRSINIHIHTSDLRLPSGAPSSPTPSSSQRPPPRAVAGVTSGAPALTVRQVTERTDAANVENGLRQIFIRGESANAAQQPGGETNPQTVTATAVQGAIMTFNENGAVRVVPVRTRPAATARGATSAGNGSNDVNPTTLLARFQQQLESLQQRSTPQTSAPGSSTAGTNSSTQDTNASLPPTNVPPIRAQVHVQSWAPTFIHDTGFSQSLVYTPATGEIVLQPQNQGAQPTTVGQQAGVNIGPPSQVSSESVPVSASSSEQAEAQRRHMADVNRAVSGPIVARQDVHEFGLSLGPLLNQIVSAFRPPGLTNDGPQTEQGNVQSPVDQLRETPEMVSSRASTVSTAEPHPNNPNPTEGGSQSQANRQRTPETAADVQTSDKMLVGTSSEDDSGSRPVTAVEDGSGERLAGGSRDTGERSPVTSTDQAQSSGQGEDKKSNPPLGLGPGGLTPLPPRGRRRSNVQQPHGASAREQSAPSSGNDLTTEQTAARNFLESFVSSVDRENDASDGSSTEQSLNQLTQGLLPLLGNLSNVVTGQAGGDSNLGDIMGQLLSRTSEGNAAQTPFPASMLRGMMGQVVQSPFMENLLQQVMSGPRGEEMQSPGLAPPGRSGEGSLDFTGVVQQMLPVITRMFGGTQTPSAGQQVPNPVGDMRQNEESASRGVSGQMSDTGRWREALSEEEAAQWNETITADVEQQQSASPQRPLSDAYVRGSPVAKRQKTELDGTAQKLQNGGAPEDVLRSVAHNVAEQFVGTNGAAHGEGSLLAEQVVGAEGLTEAYMAVLFHDLAARVAADPDFGDGTRFPNAARVFQQPKATKEPDGG
ncbi:hypothetical protein R1flu_025861 [Riccia fluitans]|uniref:Ubiquitin-like domain-containing protein n=1 Tax=Riccia fluitans TaxID=41844 RepID=A0ABD1XYZ0_9MARC